MQKYLSEDNSPQSITLIAVSPARLREEYEMGRSDQLRDEHGRKLIRIYASAGIILTSMVLHLAGTSPTILLPSVLLQFLLHLAL